MLFSCREEKTKNRDPFSCPDFGVWSPRTRGFLRTPVGGGRRGGEGLHPLCPPLEPGLVEEKKEQNPPAMGARPKCRWFPP